MKTSTQLVLISFMAMFANIFAIDLSILNQVQVPGGLANTGTNPITYTITVTNNDSIDASNVLVSCALPAELGNWQFLPGQGNYDSQANIWNVGAVAAGNFAEMTIMATVVASPGNSVVIPFTTSITTPSVSGAGIGVSTAVFGLQRGCSPNNYVLLEQARLVTDGILSLNDIQWHDVAAQSFFTVTIGVDPSTTVATVLEYEMSSGPNAAIVAFLNNALNPMSFDWHDQNGLYYIAAGCANTTSSLQLYTFDASHPNNIVTNLAQELSLAAGVNAVKWVTINGMTFLAVGLASNVLQLYQFDVAYSVPKLSLIQEITLSTSVAAVTALNWHQGTTDYYLVVGVQGAVGSSGAPLVQLYMMTDVYKPELLFVQEIAATSEQAASTCIDGTVYNGSVYFAIGTHQPLGALTQPIVTIYKLLDNGASSTLSAVASVDSSVLNGEVYSLNWKENLLIVSGSLGSYDVYGNFVQEEALRLCEFVDTPAFSCVQIDAVSTVVLNGTMMSAGWQPVANSCMLAVAGEAVDNGTSGNSSLRFYSLCFLADLEVGCVVDNTNPYENDVLTYTVTVTNNSAQMIIGAMGLLAIPGGLTVQSASPAQGTFDAVSGTWNIGTLAAGQQVVLTVTASVNAGTSGSSLTSFATAIATCVNDPYIDYQTSVTVTVA